MNLSLTSLSDLFINFRSVYDQTLSTLYASFDRPYPCDESISLNLLPSTTYVIAPSALLYTLECTIYDQEDEWTFTGKCDVSTGPFARPYNITVSLWTEEA